jgi:hypothetical protein
MIIYYSLLITLFLEIVYLATPVVSLVQDPLLQTVSPVQLEVTFHQSDNVYPVIPAV